MGNIIKCIYNASSVAARKNKYLAQGLTQNHANIVEQVAKEWHVPTKNNTVSLLQKKMQSLRTQFATEPRTININGQINTVTAFKNSGEGSNLGFWITTNGKDLKYLKFPQNAQQAYSEKLASELYNLAGIPTPKITTITETLPKKSVFDDVNVKCGLLSDFMPIEKELSISDAKLAREGFGMDCWLANWDALKAGNTIISNGKAIRLDVGGALSYRARGAIKTGEQFGENVNELTSFFDNLSHSKQYLKDMTRNELISSLDRVVNLPDFAIKDLIKNAAKYKANYSGYFNPTALNNPNYLSEVLLARKKYIKQFSELCKNTPQKSGETIEQYIRRLDVSVPKKQYQIPFDKIPMSSEVKQVNGLTMGACLTPSQKQLYDDCLMAYKESAKKDLSKFGTNSATIGKQELLHATSYNKESFEQILNNGIYSGEICKRSGTGVETQTPLCADFWEVLESMPIGKYFSRHRYNKGELNFLPKLESAGGLKVSNRGQLVFVFNKNKIDPILLKNSVNIATMKTPSGMQSILYKDGNFGGHRDYITHRAIPIGVPSNALSKIIVNTSKMTPSQISEMKSAILEKGLNINLYDLLGNIL